MSAQVLKTGFLHLPFPTLASPPRHSSCSHARSATSLDSNRFSSEHGPVASRVHSRPTAADMSATYQPSYGSYDNHAAHNYPAAVAHSNRPKAAVADSRSLQYLRCPPQPVQQQALSQPQQVLRHDIPNKSQQPQREPRHSARPPTPSADIAMPTQGSRSRRNSDTLIFHSLQIPKCISPAGGNLADFAAQMTCLFWFQSADDLKKAETIRSIPTTATLPRLSSLAKPYDQFRKWVLNVLQTTQVTQNVILLALLFIYRLKMSTPQIKGRAGSEYRLLTVALMLGNKFLDDNTYTNKTWAEVSCFAVQEIHVMEVEFLSNMRYNLLASKEEWEVWLTKLACFHEYYDRAVRQPASPLHLAANVGMFQSPISSPKVNMLPMVPDLPPYTPTTARAFSPTSNQAPDWHAYNANAVSPLASKPARLTSSRKRSPEYDAADHPAKRQVPPQMASGMLPSNGVRQAGAFEARPLGPQLSIVTSQGPSTGAPYLAAGHSYAPGPNMPLPPLQSGVRAMSTIYQQPAGGVVPQPQPQPQPQPLQQMMPVVTMAPGYPTSATAVHPPVHIGTPSKRRSPGTLVQYTSSPMAEVYAAGSAMHTPLALTPLANSPSIYLQQRSSPYRPVRHVNRLLHPASTSLDQYHLSVPINPNQIHYQPLGRRNDVRTGVVPEFIKYNRQQQQQPPQGRHHGAYP
ncbi:hypothetical protein LLEC1_00876 [Akanthomyces lecanii]|uniref:Cyclin N-terminal domain-containing protein n=1 Tax=Cordyceps confragosa TaxID=2714763 RepID=A0A179IH02_CORDF|nr:hypothetical protein LLEC1_00876 [Akanthomyces lecanii]